MGLIILLSFLQLANFSSILTSLLHPFSICYHFPHVRMQIKGNQANFAASYGLCKLHLTCLCFLCSYDMLPFEHQLEIANQIGTTRSQIISNLNDLAIGTSFLWKKHFVFSNDNVGCCLRLVSCNIGLVKLYNLLNYETCI